MLGAKRKENKIIISKIGAIMLILGFTIVFLIAMLKILQDEVLYRSYYYKANEILNNITKKAIIFASVMVVLGAIMLSIALVIFIWKIA